MIVLWHVRYVDRNEKRYKGRNLWLDTRRLDAATRAAVELAVEMRLPGTERSILKFRHLFQECKPDASPEHPTGNVRSFNTAVVMDYTEDESGHELTRHEVASILTGSAKSILIPNGASQHDIDYMLAQPKPIPVSGVNLSPEHCTLFGYFARDLEELRKSAFLEDGPGTLSGTGVGLNFFSGGADPVLETAVSDDELRSFTTIFRRLYMKNEPAHFLGAARLFSEVIGDHPLSAWTTGTACRYETELEQVIDARPFFQLGDITFTRKRLIDVFLYTQYAHQPDSRRQRQYSKCLNETQGRKAILTWMFLMEIWKSSLHICNAGKVIVGWFRHYCDHHQAAVDVLGSLASDIPGIGAKEKDAARRLRVLREKAEDLAIELWKENSRPEGGPMQFLPAAQEQLRKAMQ